MIYLHIGRHKTGTSALQQLLRKNRNELGEHGYTYLPPVRGGAGNHDLADALNPAFMARADAAQRAIAAAEIETTGKRLGHRTHQIVSSEAFQNAPPASVAGFFPAGRTTVVVYLREQLDYLLSAYAQFIQAQIVRTSFADYVRPLLNVRYDAFLDSWADAFGPDLVKARIYAREHLKDGDVRHDFLDLIGIDPAWLTFRPGLVNPTIGPDLIEAKGLLNTFVPAAVQAQADTFNMFAGLAARMPGRLGVGSDFAARFRDRFAQSNERLFARYLGHIAPGFPMKDFTPGSAPVDPAGALDRALALAAETAPDAVAKLRAHLPDAATLRAQPPLLPQDWDAAAGQI